MRHLCILLAEDNHGDILLVREALRAHCIDCELFVVDDGEQAVKLVAELGQPGAFPCPDVLVLDINLPKADGEQVLREFRKHPQCGNRPVIAISSSGAAQDRQRMGQLGVAHYFQKPSELDEFLQLGALIRKVAMA